MEKLNGTIERITYYNDENGYSVLKIVPDQRRMDTARDGTLTVVGFLPELNIGEPVEFTGEWVENSQYGRQFKADPYVLADEVHGIGFIKADTIAQSMGVAPDSPGRMRAGLFYALGQAANEGHVFMPRDELLDKTSELLKIQSLTLLESVLEQQVVTHKLDR